MFGIIEIISEFLSLAPDAFKCPPPPNSPASLLTGIFPLDLKLTLNPCFSSIKSIPSFTPSIDKIKLTKFSVSLSRALNSLKSL